MPLARLEGWLHRWVRVAAEHQWLVRACAVLAALGTLTAAFPVTAVVVPAVLMMPTRWRQIAMACAVGSAVGATALVEIVHALGWEQLVHWLPSLAGEAEIQGLKHWAEDYGILSLFIIAATPLPQTPALVFFGIAGHHFVAVFLAMLFGKLLKYGVFAWLASRFPERFLGREAVRPAESIQSVAEEKHETKH